MSDTPNAPRAYASGVSMTLFGTMTLTVDLLPARRSDNVADPKLVCPACEEGVKLQQQYADKQSFQAGKAPVDCPEYSYLSRHSPHDDTEVQAQTG